MKPGKLSIWDKVVQQLFLSKDKGGELLGCALLGEDLWSTFLWHYIMQEEHFIQWELPPTMKWSVAFTNMCHIPAFANQSLIKYGLSLDNHGKDWPKYIEILYEQYKQRMS